MKTTFALVILALFCFSCKKEQSEPKFRWEPINLNYTGDFEEVYFVNKDTGFIWQPNAYGVTRQNQSVIFTTVDGGSTWKKIEVNWKPFEGTYQFYPQSGHVLYASAPYSPLDSASTHHAYKSTDGGKNWALLKLPIPGNRPRIIHFRSGNEWIVADGGNVYRTTNAGTSYQQVASDLSPGYAGFSLIQFPASQVGFVAGGDTHEGINYGIMAKTTDGGQHWNAINPDSKDIIAMDFVNTQTGFTATSAGELWQTKDGGSGWTKAGVTPYPFPNGLHFYSETDGLLAASKAIYRTKDGGKTWTTEFENEKVEILKTFFVGNTCFAVGRNGLVLHRVR